MFMLVLSKRRSKNDAVQPIVEIYGEHSAGELKGHMNISNWGLLEPGEPALVVDKVKYFTNHSWGFDRKTHNPLIALPGSVHEDYYKILYEEKYWFVKVADVEEYLAI